MNNSAVTLGFWSSLIAAISLILFTGCFMAIILTQEPVIWSDLDSYLQQSGANNPAFKYIAQTSMLVFGIAYVVILHSINAMVYTRRQIYSRISLSFGIIFAALIGINYFLQITHVRFNTNAGITEGLANWIMFNPDSVILSIAMLGWTVMFGLSSLFISKVFQARGRDRTIRNLFVLNGVCCLLGGIGFVFQNVVLVNLTINLGMGGIMTFLTIMLTWHYHQERKYL